MTHQSKSLLWRAKLIILYETCRYTVLTTCVLSRYLSDLELRVHLAAEDIDAALDVDSGRALHRIPAAVQEVSLLHVRASHCHHIA